MDKSLKTTVLIVTYNGEEYIEKCLSSVIKSEPVSEIMVVDNNSSDNTVSIIRKSFPGVHLIISDTNVGFGKGNNIGLRRVIESNSDYVFLLNQDAWVEPDTISELVKQARLNKEYGILSPVHLDETGYHLGSYFSKMVSDDGCPGFINDLYFNRLKELYEIEFIHASGWLLRKSMFKKVGIFDPIFPHYGEDKDFAHRVNYFKFKIGICTNSKFYHVGRYDQTHQNDQNDELYFNNINLLVEFKKLNKSYRLILFNSVIKTFTETFLSLLTGKFSRIKKCWKPVFFILKQSRSIRISRKKSIEGAAFIVN